MVEFLDNYERHYLFSSFEVVPKRMRCALGWSPNHLKETDQEAITHPIWEKICSLLTVYRCLDAHTHWRFTGTSQPLTSSEINTRQKKLLTSSIAGKLKIWDKLENWSSTLHDLRLAFEANHAESLIMNMPALDSQDVPHIGLVVSLAKTNSTLKYNYLLNNFSTAVMHLCYMMTMPGVSVSPTKAVLPDIPDSSISLLQNPDILKGSHSGLPLDHAEAVRFLRRTTASKLRIPLQLALLISPICLLATRNLHLTKCDRLSLLQAAEALGNERPPDLAEFEEAIRAALFRAALAPKTLIGELNKLITSEIWKKCESLSPSSEAATFFKAPDVQTGDAAVHETCPQSGLSPICFRGNDVNTQQVHAARVSSGGTQETNVTEKETSRTDSFGGPRGKAADEGEGACNPPAAQPATTNNVGRIVQKVIDQVNKEVSGKGTDLDGQQMEMEVDEDSRIGGNAPFERNVEEQNTVMEVLEEDNNMGGTSIFEANTEGQQPPMEVDPEWDEDSRMGRKTVSEVNVGGQNTTKEVVTGMEKERMDTMLAVSATTDREAPAVMKPSRILRERKPKKDIAPQVKAAPASSSRKRRLSPAKSPTKKDLNSIPQEGSKYTDVAMWMPREVTLDVKAQPPKIAAKVMKVYGPTGDAVDITPLVHGTQTVKILEGLWAKVEMAYKNGLPLHRSDAPQSAFRILPDEESQTLSTTQWQDILRSKNVVLTGQPHKTLTFRKALQRLGKFNTVMTIQDQSVAEHVNYNLRRREGTFGQLWEASQSPQGKVLNALDIGLPGSGLEETGYASNVAALAAMRGEWKSSFPPPMEEVSWALAATSGAFHPWHIDCNGFMTFVSPVCGEKLWIIGRPASGDSFNDLCRTNLFTTQQYDMNDANEHLWTLEAILLRPGDTLIMRPNTPHAVFTPSASVVHGGHCYASSTLPDTLVGMIHAFIVGTLITNTEHGSARFHLQEMIEFYHMALIEKGLEEDDDRWEHVPKLETTDGHRELMAICIYGILINALDPGTYLHPDQGDDGLTRQHRQEMILQDVNSLTHEERIGCMYTRGQAFQLLEYVERAYKIQTTGQRVPWKDLKSFHEDVIAHQCLMILNYKDSVAEGIKGAPQCDRELLSCQLLGLGGEQRLRDKIVRGQGRHSVDTISMSLLSLGAPLTKLPASSRPKLEFENPLITGTNYRDELYLASRGRKPKFEKDVDDSDMTKRCRI